MQNNRKDPKKEKNIFIKVMTQGSYNGHICMKCTKNTICGFCYNTNTHPNLIYNTCQQSK